MSNNETKKVAAESTAPEVKAEKKGSGVKTSLSVVGIIICVFLALLLVCNIVIIVKGSSNDKRPPSVFGITPMLVRTASMSEENALPEHQADHIETSDLIFVDSTPANEIQVGDVISYMEGDIVVTHKVHSITEADKSESGQREFITFGINNWGTETDEDGKTVKKQTIDDVPVVADDLIGRFVFRVPLIGSVIYFMSEPLGMICFIGIPLLAFIIFDIIRRQRAANKEDKKTAELQAELERLRALAGEENKQEASQQSNQQ